ncbi:MAG TPA: NAD(P)/FAD-dependent oxidoreductase [Methanobacterium sp.]
MYDVAVIGAGPAGCMASKRMAEAGYEVLLVEKMELPREKSCSGILIPKSIQMVEKEFGEIPGTVFSHPKINRGIKLTNEDGQVFSFESEGYTIWRNLFDQWIAHKARDAGVELKDLTLAKTCEEINDHVMLTLKERKKIYHEKARIVIVCEGAGGLIKKNIRKESGDFIVTYQTFSKGNIDLASDFFHAFLNPHFSEYDAWFNVKDDYLIIGVGVKNASQMKSYHSKFVSFLKSHYNAQIEPPEKEEVGIIPEIRPSYTVDLGEGRVLFAGDAANLLNPMGEGISSALASGYAAAEAIKSNIHGNNINSGNILKSYESKLNSEIEYMIRQWKFLGTISPNFS